MMPDANLIAAALEQYGGTAVSDMIARIGSGYDVAVLIGLEAGMRLSRLTRFETDDERTFRGR